MASPPVSTTNGVSMYYRILFVRTTGFTLRKYVEEDRILITSKSKECDILRRNAEMYRPDLVPMFDEISAQKVTSTPPDEEGNVFCAIGLGLGESWAVGNCWFSPWTKQISRKKILAVHQRNPGEMQDTGLEFLESDPDHRPDFGQRRDENGNKILLMYIINNFGETLSCFAKEGRDGDEYEFTDQERCDLGIGELEYRSYHALWD